MASKYKSRLGEMEEDLATFTKNKYQMSCVPVLLITGGVVPLITGAILYFVNPKFISEETKSGEKKRSTKKLLLWTGGITLACWMVLYALSCCEAFTSSLACVFS